MQVLNYRVPGSSQTLADGLREYYDANPGFEEGEFLGQSREVVQAHDVCHVVFGCGSTAADELIVEMWTLFGCYVPPRDYVQMTRSGIVQQILKTFGVVRLLRRFVLTLPRVWRAFWATRHLQKKWPHFDYQTYWQTPLCDIRREFGIVIV